MTSILFEDDDPSRRPIGAQYESKPSNSSETQTGTIHFDFLVDASGRAAIMSQKYLKNRHFNKNLDNVACWGYWTGCQRYSPGTPRENAVWLEALQGRSLKSIDRSFCLFSYTWLSYLPRSLPPSSSLLSCLFNFQMRPAGSGSSLFTMALSPLVSFKTRLPRLPRSELCGSKTRISP